MTNPAARRRAPWYDGSGKQPGTYVHPHDPSRFITLDAGLEAWEQDCPPDENSPTGRMIYGPALDRTVPCNEAEHAGLFTDESRDHQDLPD